MNRGHRRRCLQGVAIVLALSVARTGLGQGEGAVPRVGWLSPGTPTSHGHHLEAFIEGLAEHGYRPGDRITIEERWARGRLDAVPEATRQLVALGVRVIVVGSTPVAVRARTVTTTIPIIHATGANPVLAGLARSLARPGGNVTGITTLSDDLVGKMVELMAEALPDVRAVCVMHNPDNTNDRFFVSEVDRVSPGDWKIERLAIRVRSDLPKLDELLALRRPHAMLVMADPVLITLRRDIVNRFVAARMPAMFAFEEFVEAGGLMSYGVHLPSNYRRAAYFVDRVLRGANVADLPVEQPVRLNFVLNLGTAKSLGIRIAPTAMMRVNRLIE